MAERYNHELLLGYLEDELSPEKRARFEAQLGSDPELRRLVEQLAVDRAGLRELPHESPPPTMVEDALQQIERQMLLGDPADEPIPIDTTPRLPRRHRVLKAMAYTGLAASLLLSGGLILVSLTDLSALETARQLARIGQAEEPARPPVAFDDAAERARENGEPAERPESRRSTPTLGDAPLDGPDDRDATGTALRSGDGDETGDRLALEEADAAEDAVAGWRERAMPGVGLPSIESQLPALADLGWDDAASPALPGGRSADSLWESRRMMRAERREADGEAGVHANGGGTFGETSPLVLRGTNNRPFEQTVEADRYAEAERLDTPGLTLSQSGSWFDDDAADVDAPASPEVAAAMEVASAMAAEAAAHERLAAGVGVAGDGGGGSAGGVVTAGPGPGAAAVRQRVQVQVVSADAERTRADVVNWAISNQVAVLPAAAAPAPSRARGDEAGGDDDATPATLRQFDAAVDGTREAVDEQPAEPAAMGRNVYVRLEQQQLPELVAYLNRDVRQQRAQLLPAGEDEQAGGDEADEQVGQQLEPRQRARVVEPAAPAAESAEQAERSEPTSAQSGPLSLMAWEQLLRPQLTPAPMWSPTRLAEAALMEVEVWIVPSPGGPEGADAVEAETQTVEP